MRNMLAIAIAALCAATLPAVAHEPAAGAEPDPVHVAAGHSLAGTLSLNASTDGRDARRTPVFDHYRPKVEFAGRDVVCMFELLDVRSLAPGESGAVTMTCKEPVAVKRDATRRVVVEGGKRVGHVDVRLPPPASR